MSEYRKMLVKRARQWANSPHLQHLSVHSTRALIRELADALEDVEVVEGHRVLDA